MTDASLADLSPYIFGTTRLGDGKIPFADRVAMARRAMDAGIWFHSSDQYGDALDVLRAAFDQDRERVPNLIFKLHGGTPDEISVLQRRWSDETDIHAEPWSM